MFPDQKSYEKEFNASMEEGIGYGESEERLPRRSRRNPNQTMREEQENKEIMMGSQQTLDKMMGVGSKPQKSPGNNVPPRGGSSKS
jgi:hypothetical protein